MARQRRSRDWQERAFEVGQTKRSDSKVGESQDLPEPVKVSAGLPRRSSLRWTALGLVVIVVAVLIHNGIRDNAPSLTKSCTTPAMALSTTSTHRGSVVRYSVTGSPSATLVIAIGVSALTPGSTPGQLHVVPDSGRSPKQTEIAVKPGQLDSSCKASGDFGVNVPAGKYTVQLFRLTSPSTAQVTATAVAAKPLTVAS